MKITGRCCALLAFLSLVAGCVVEDVQPATAGAAVTDDPAGADGGTDASSLQVSHDEDYAAMFGDLP